MGILKFSGDFELSALEIISKNKTLDISNLVMELNLYEDLFSDGLQADISLSDSRNLPLNLPLVGEETLNLIFNTPTFDDPNDGFNLELPIVSMPHRKDIRDRQQIITLRCISEPQLNSSKTQVCRAYSDMTHSTIVKEIFQEYMNPDDVDDLFIEDSKYIENLVIPRQKPLEAIKFITERTTSKSDTADFLFFERRDGYHFKSLNSLYAQEPKVTLTNSVGGTEGMFILIRILGNYMAKTYDTQENIERGMLASTLFSYNALTKEINTNTFSYKDDFENTNHLGTQKLVFDDNKLEDPNNHIFVESINENTRTNSWIHKRRSQLQVLNNHRLIVDIHGNSSFNIGEIVNFDMKSTDILNTSIDAQSDNHLSGKWLITSIRHKITTKQHIMVLDLAKESLNDKLIIEN